MEKVEVVAREFIIPETREIIIPETIVQRLRHSSLLEKVVAFAVIITAIATIILLILALYHK